MWSCLVQLGSVVRARLSVLCRATRRDERDGGAASRTEDTSEARPRGVAVTALIVVVLVVLFVVAMFVANQDQTRLRP